MTRRRIRIAAVLGGLVLLAGPRIAPSLPISWIVPVSILWLAVLAALLLLAARILAATLGAARGLALLTTLLAAGLLVTGADWSGSIGTRMPCRRDWGWLPSWLLRSSPTGSLVFEVGGHRVKLCYGRPAARGRRMIGGPAVPFGHLWRTGANEPTVLRASHPVAVAGIRVRGGKASLYTVPGPETWELILNASTTQWGIESRYTEAIAAQELGRAVVPVGQLDRPEERLTFRLEPSAGDTVMLTLRWERTRVSIPVWPAD